MGWSLRTNPGLKLAKPVVSSSGAQTPMHMSGVSGWIASAETPVISKG
jgi:hypothetical protein